MERPDLADELKAMADVDLALRQRLADSGELFAGYNPEMRAVHRRNGDRLETMLAELDRWPGFRLVGRDGSWAAFLVAQHDIANPQLLRRCRDLYTAAVDRADADPHNLARIEDRIRYFEGRPQLYGTHWGWNDSGEFGPWPPIQEPEEVDGRRERLGLPPLVDAIEAARAGRPPYRPVDEVLIEHQQAEDFARQVGWRADDRHLR